MCDVSSGHEQYSALDSGVRSLSSCGEMGGTRVHGATFRCWGLLAFWVAVLASRTLAQFEPENPVQVIVNVFIGSLQNPAASNVTVQLLDRFGSLEKEQHTDSSGRAEFRTKTATKHIRI